MSKYFNVSLANIAVCTCMFVLWVYACAYCVCMCACMCVCVCMCVWGVFHGCAGVTLCACVYLRLSVRECHRKSLHIHVCMSDSVFSCACLRARVCVMFYVYVCTRGVAEKCVRCLKANILTRVSHKHLVRLS